MVAFEVLRMHAVWKLVFLSLLTALLIFLYFLMFLLSVNCLCNWLTRFPSPSSETWLVYVSFWECLPSGPGSKLECSSSIATGVPE